MQYDYLKERYIELDVLGNSGKENTYLVKDSVTGQIAVKKYISKENARIYQQLQHIRHRNLVDILYVAEGAEDALVIMDYVSGQTLEEYQKKKQGCLFEKEAEEIIVQLLEGLSVIHKYGLVHRDINPKNILMSIDGVIKIIDFDIGRIHKEHQRWDTEFLGTAGFAAPEQFGFSQSDARTDIYAVGVVLNHLLTGKLPGEYCYPHGQMMQVIQTSTRMEPEARYHSAEEMLTEIKAGMSPDTELEKRCAVDSGREEYSIIPGFRTGKVWKEVLAGSYYILGGIYSVASVVECSITFQAAVLELMAIFLYCWASVFLAFDFLHWMEKIPFVHRRDKSKKIVIGCILWIVLFCIGALLESYVRNDLLHIVPQMKSS